MQRPQRVLGIDIGGANLKLATWTDKNSVECASMPFPLWKQPRELGTAVRYLIDQLGGADQLAVTMTGELADCYATRRHGVEEILEQLTGVIATDEIQVYAVGGRWFSVQAAGADPWSVAASNWYALAHWLGRWQLTWARCKRSVLVDIGSTTVDVIPMKNGLPFTDARTDRERLAQCQLVYTGLSRTPVCAITSSLRLADHDVPVMAEVFATADDAYVCLGLVAENPHECDTADGRPRTRPHAAARLARMLGEDCESLTPSDIADLAEQVVDAQARLVAQAIERNWALLMNDQEHCATSGNAPGGGLDIVSSGHGRPLFDRAFALITTRAQATGRTQSTTQPRVCMLSDLLPACASRCAPAVAVAWLASYASDASLGHQTDFD